MHYHRSLWAPVGICFLLVLSNVSWAESFDPAEVEVVQEDRAFLVELEQGTRRARLLIQDEDGNWEPFHIAHLAGDEGILKMRVPDNVSLQDCKVEVSMEDPFPYSYYQGETAFSQQETAGFNRFGGDAAFDGGAGAPEEDNGGGDPDAVQESDLWQWVGDILYLFNQWRGLQVYDLSTPAEPKRLATLRMPAVGDQMYLLDDEHVLLLANYVNYSAYGWWDIALPYSSVQQTEAIVVKHSGEKLEIVERVPFEGDYVESRLVGERLYLVTRINLPQEDEEGGIYWKNGLQVNGVDLSDPANPVKKESLELTDSNGWFWNSVVTASPDYLLVSTSHYDNETRLTRSRVYVVPIGRDLDKLAVAHEVDLKAQLNDKFKLRVKDGYLTTVTQKWVWREELTTYVESFDLNGEKARKLDEIILAPRERLHATRFDGDRLYVVTFFVELRKDPLFVIDLSDPNNLKTLGELEIPGWSTYLVPEGDRLLSVGIEENRVAISLFDVGDPNNPTLVQRVYPGDGRTWSVANWDEKAVSYKTDLDLLLLPIQTQSKTPNGGYQYRNLMQLVDVKHDSLEVRGAIEHHDYVQAQRATVLNETEIVSLSGRELIVVEASDRDEPEVLVVEPLAWDVQRVVEAGDYLLQFGNSQAWNAESVSTTVRVTSKNDHDEVIRTFELPGGKIAGTYQDGRYLYVGRLRQWNERVRVEIDDKEIPEEVPDDERWVERWVYRSEFATDVVDLADPTEPKLIDTVIHKFEDQTQSGGLHQVIGYLADDHLIWRPAIQENHYYFGPFFGGDVAVDFDGGIARDIWWPGYGGGFPSYDQIAIIAVNVSDRAALEIASVTTIDPNEYAQFGPILRHQENLVVSYKESRFDEQTYLHRYHLREIDLSDPSQPELGDPVNVPGIIRGVQGRSGDGVVLFSTAPKIEQKEEHWLSTSHILLQASVYDGLSSFLIAQTTLDEGSFSRKQVLDGKFYQSVSRDQETGLAVWSLVESDDSASLEETGFIELENVPTQLAVHEGLLFAEASQTVSVIDDPESVTQQLSGPVYTQNLSAVEVSADRLTAWIAVNSYGVETLDLSGLGAIPNGQIAAQVENGWDQVSSEVMCLVTAQGTDYVGALAENEPWRFRSTEDLRNYHTWTIARFNPAMDDGVAIPGPDEDRDQDGAVTLIEFLFQTDPNDASSHRIPRASIENHEGNMRLEASDPEFTAEDVTSHWQRSTDLRNWMDVEGEIVISGREANVFYRQVFEVSAP